MIATRPTFTYVALTEWGSVLIVPANDDWYEVRFQERYQSDEELLGTFQTVALAVEAACVGALEVPSVGVCLSAMKLPQDVNDWAQHLRARA